MNEVTTLFGIRALLEAIENKVTIEKIYLSKNNLQGTLFAELDKLIKAGDYTVSYVPVEKLNKLSKNNNHQGVVAKVSPIEYQNLETIIEKVSKGTSTPLYLILDQISDVRNFGAIIRTAECTGVNAIIVQQNGSAPVNAETIKTSAGAAFKVPICKVNHIKDAIYLLKTFDVQIIAASEKTDTTIYHLDLKKPTAIIMGSEHKGVNPSVLKIVDQTAKLPLLGTIDSLNVSVACGAFLYEIIRQRIV